MVDILCLTTDDRAEMLFKDPTVREDFKRLLGDKYKKFIDINVRIRYACNMCDCPGDYHDKDTYTNLLFQIPKLLDPKISGLVLRTVDDLRFSVEKVEKAYQTFIDYIKKQKDIKCCYTYLISCHIDDLKSLIKSIE